MTSAISFSNIDTTYPIPGRDNDSQGFRTNFSLIKDALETASDEISLLQAGKADLIEQSLFSNLTNSVSSSTGAVVISGGLGVGGDVNIGGYITVNDGIAILTSATTLTVTMSDVLASGTILDPVFELNDTINKSIYWRGSYRFSSTSTYDLANGVPTKMYVTTNSTSTSDTTSLHSRVTNNGIALKLDTKGPTYEPKYISFTTTNGSNVETEVGYLQILQDGQTLVLHGHLALDTTNAVPTTPTSTGIRGQIAFDTDHLYICVGNNSWKRVSLGTWT